MVAANKLQKTTGVYVFEVIADGNVYNRELRVGDIIVEMDGKPIGSVDDMHRLFTYDMIGVRTQIGVLREGHKQFIQIIPGEMQ